MFKLHALYMIFTLHCSIGFREFFCVIKTNVFLHIIIVLRNHVYPQCGNFIIFPHLPVTNRWFYSYRMTLQISFPNIKYWLGSNIEFSFLKGGRLDHFAVAVTSKPQKTSWVLQLVIIFWTLLYNFDLCSSFLRNSRRNSRKLRFCNCIFAIFTKGNLFHIDFTKKKKFNLEWKNEKFTLIQNIFCEINSCLSNLVETMLSRNFC